MCLFWGRDVEAIFICHSRRRLPYVSPDKVVEVVAIVGDKALISGAAAAVYNNNWKGGGGRMAVIMRPARVEALKMIMAAFMFFVHVNLLVCCCTVLDIFISG